jgi:hypothetical protein
MNYVILGRDGAIPDGTKKTAINLCLFQGNKEATETGSERALCMLGTLPVPADAPR